MMNYPKSSSVWTVLSSDHLLHVEDGYINPYEEPERWRELDFEKRAAQAIRERARSGSEMPSGQSPLETEILSISLLLIVSES
jgi:hypothetical protein